MQLPQTCIQSILGPEYPGDGLFFDLNETSTVATSVLGDFLIGECVIYTLFIIANKQLVFHVL